MCQRRQNSVIDCDLVRRIEILGEHESHHQAEADRHVRVAAEIEVDLEGIGGDAVPGVEPCSEGPDSNARSAIFPQGLASRTFLVMPSAKNATPRVNFVTVCVRERI